MPVILNSTFLNVNFASKALLAETQPIANTTINVSMDIMFPNIVPGVLFGIRILMPVIGSSTYLTVNSASKALIGVTQTIKPTTINVSMASKSQTIVIMVMFGMRIPITVNGLGLDQIAPTPPLITQMPPLDQIAPTPPLITHPTPLACALKAASKETIATAANSINALME